MKGRTWLPGGRVAEWLLAVAVLLGAFAGVVAWTGGFDLRVWGMRLRSHDWIRPLAAATIALGAATWIDRGRVAGAFRRLWSALAPAVVVRGVTVIAIVWTLFAGWWFGTRAIGGADSYGYVSQARLLAEGRLVDTVPFGPEFRWPHAEYTLRPLGFSSGQGRGQIAPTYPPGLPLLLAPLTRLGDSAVFALVPLFGALAIVVTCRLGARLGDPVAGALAALLLSVSPVFLYQGIQPMSDVPATACWLSALLVAYRATTSAAAGAGLLASLAILIRPNLAPLACVVALPLVWPISRASLARAAIFGGVLVPGVVWLGYVQAVRYGSPIGSGYGSFGDVFALSNVAPNLGRYPRWLTESETPFIWLWLAAPLWIALRSPSRALGWCALLLVAGVWAAYLPYIYFQPQEWFYTRFLLPALPLMLFFACATLLLILQRLPVAARVSVVVATVVTLVVLLVGSADRHGAFDLRTQEQKYPRAGAFVRDSLPPTAFVLAMQHSGSIRYYAGRPTLRWDLLEATSLDRALASLRASGYEPFAVLDASEDGVFRKKFEESEQESVRRMTPLADLGTVHVYGFER
jgi:hypothetical protein